MNWITKDKHWVLTATEDEITRWAKFGYVSPEGIVYNTELAGPQGADYFIFPAPHHTEQDINDTKEWIHTSFDCCSLVVGNPLGEYPLPATPPTWTPEQREAGFRKIVLTKSFTMVEDCIIVDLFTASTVVQVLDALSPQNKAKMLNFPASKMIDVTWKVLDSAKE